MPYPANPYALGVDENYYFSLYPDVAASGMTAAEHYSLYGSAEGRSPNALFDREYYLAANPDVAAAGVDPFEHFLTYGLHEGRSPTPLFDATFYLAQNPDVQAAVEAGTMTAVEHFIRFGQAEGRSPDAALNLSAYLDANPDVRAAVEAGGTDALTHLLTFGFTEGRDLGNGVHLADFAADSVFESAVAAHDGEAALARVAAVAPFFPGFQGPEGWQPAADTPIPTDFTPVDGAVLRVPEGVEIPEGVTLSRDVFLPYLTVAVNEGVLSFGGNAEGEITLDLVDGVPTVTREGSSVAITDPEAVTGVALGDATLSAPVEALDGRSATGTGTLLLSGLQAGTDLSGLSDSLDVTVTLSGDLDITGNATLGTVDTFRTEEGATLTLAAGQAEAAALEGQYVVQDTAAAFFDGAAPQSFVAEAAGLVVTDMATLDQLTALRAAFEGELSYDSLSGDHAALLADIASNDGEGTFVVPGKAVLVTDAASLAELDAIDAANGDAGVSVTAVADTAANLMNDGTPFARVTEGIAVTVTDAASLDQLASIDAANGGGALHYTSISDTAAALVANTDGYVQDGIDVTVTDAANLDQLAVIDAANGDGALNYAGISDTAATLAANAGNYVQDGTDVTVTDAANLAQLATIDGFNGNGDLSYTAVTDGAAALAANAGGYVQDGTDVTVTDAANLAQLAAIDGFNGNGDLSYTAVTDGAAALAANAGGYVQDGIDVTVTDAATIAQLVAIDGFNGDGALNHALVTDGWQALLSADAGAYLSDTTTIRLTSYNLGAVTVSDVQQLLAISALVDGGGDHIELADLTYTLNDLPANLAQGSAEDIVVHADAVAASEPATVAQAMTIYGWDATATYAITDSAGALASDNTDADAAIRHAGDLVATTAASAAQAPVIYARDGAGDVHYDITDNFQALNGLATDVRNTAHDITVNGSIGGFLTTADASTAAAWSNVGATTIHSIRGTAAEASAFVSGHQETSGDTALRYDFSVWDSASGVLNEISANHLSFASGNAAADLTDDNTASSITVSGAFTVDQTLTFWNAVQPIFGSDETTAQRTYYGVSDSVADYTNAKVANGGIPGADYLNVVDTAAAVHAAQNGIDAGHSDIFSLLASRTNGSDYLTVSGSAGDQYIRGASGGDYINGGTGADYLDGGTGKDTLYAGDTAANTVWSSAIYNGTNTIIGGQDGDNMFGSADFDNFIYQGADRSQLIAESGTTQWTRDYITNFNLGDRILFQGVDSVQFLSNGLGNASTVDADSTGLAIRYEKNVQVLNYAGNDVINATRVLIDVSDSSGHFDNVPDMHIILVGSNIDVNWDGGALIFGG